MFKYKPGWFLKNFNISTKLSFIILMKTGSLLSKLYVISIEEYFKQTITVAVFRIKGKK